jgi:putative ABC transport system permease protein
MRNFLLDFRYGLRTLRNAPGFALVAVFTLALGIAANVGMFSVIEAVMLQPLPVAAPERLGVVSAEDIRSRDIVGASWTKFQLVQSQSRAFDGIAGYVQREFIFTDGVNPEQVNGARVTNSFLNVLGVRPILGRNFVPADDLEGADPTALVTYGFWQRHLGGEAGAIGKTLRIDDQDTTVIGVLPRNFKFQFGDREPQLYLTRVFTPAVLTSAQIQVGAGFLTYIARLKAGTTFTEAQAELDTINNRYREEFANFVDSTKYDLRLIPLATSVFGDLRPTLLILMGAVGLLLLLACANVAHLLLTRAAARKREIAMRLALGASSMRVIRQFIAESLVLALLGCAAGLPLAAVGIRVLTTYGPRDIPRLSNAGIGGWVLLFAILVSFITAILFGVAPAWRASNMRVNEALKEGSSMTLGRRRGMIHKLLACSEVAIACALLISAALLLESLARLQRVDPGFDAQRVLTAQISLPPARYPQPTQREAFFTQLIHNLQAQPGMQMVGATSILPMSGTNLGIFFYVEGQPSLGTRDSVISVRHVSADYFRAMRIPVRAGRFFTEQDNAQSQPVVIVNETAAKRYFAGKNAVGLRLASSGDHIMREIVGVVGDVKFDGPAQPDREELYFPYLQVPRGAMTFVLRSGVSTDKMVAALRHEVARLDPDQPVSHVRVMDSIVAGSMSQQHFTTSLLGIFAFLALSISCIGLYGVLAFLVTQRTREFGIRMALGATRKDVLQLVLRQGLGITFSGIGIGVPGALAASRLLRSLLFGVTRLHASIYLGSAALLSVIALLACMAPMLRATRVQPTVALRYE